MPTNDEPLGITGAIFFTCRIPLLSPDHQCQSTKGVGANFQMLGWKKKQKCRFVKCEEVSVYRPATGYDINRYRHKVSVSVSISVSTIFFASIVNITGLSSTDTSDELAAVLSITVSTDRCRTVAIACDLQPRTDTATDARHNPT